MLYEQRRRWLDCEHAKTRTILGRYYDKFYFHIGTLNDTLCTPLAYCISEYGKSDVKLVKQINPYMPSFLFVEYRQTVETRSDATERGV